MVTVNTMRVLGIAMIILRGEVTQWISNDVYVGIVLTLICGSIAVENMIERRNNNE